jgi:hypothetical protein
MAHHHKEKSQQLTMRSLELKATAKTAKGKKPDWVYHHFPLFNLITQQKGKFMIMTKSYAERLGESSTAH